MTPLAIISGATGGIGSVVTGALWEAGYSVLCLGRNLGRLEGHARWFMQHPRPGQDSYVLGFDVRFTEHYWRLHHLVEPEVKTHPVTVLAVCHGAAPRPGSAEQEATLEEARVVWETDVLGTYRLASAVWPYMVEGGGGSISIVSSLHAKATYPQRVPYATAKAALSGLTHGLALDWGKDQIRVNSILAWQVQGSRTVQVASKEGGDTLPLYLAKSPLRRLVEPQDVASTILWLAQCPSVTGTEITLDCGVSASMWHRPFEEG